MNSFFTTLALTAIGASYANAAIIVGLAPADPSLMYDQTGGLLLSTTAPSNNNAGLTMNITFTPSSIDIGQTANAINLLEIGGNANGSGLYMLGGELIFLSKMQGVGNDVPGGFNDLDFSSGNNLIALKSNFGPLTAGTEYSVGVLYDPLGSATLTLAVLPTESTLSQETVGLVGIGVKNNWSGNDTITSFLAPGNAGAGNFVSGDPFQEGAGAMKDLDGIAGRALMWNTQGTIVPEPSGFTLLGLTSLLLLRRGR